MKALLNSLALVTALAAVGCATSGRPPKLSGEIVKVGDVRVDSVTRTVVITGYFNQAQGPVELLACGPGGKRHESIFVLEANPIDIQTAMLLVGAQSGAPMKQVGQGPPLGSKLDIWVEWTRDGAAAIEDADYFIYQVKKGKPLGRVGWIFNGSTVEDGQFKALAEESMIATYWDPWAIMNIDSPVGSDDELLSVNEQRVPPVGTPATLYLHLR